MNIEEFNDEQLVIIPNPVHTYFSIGIHPITSKLHDLSYKVHQRVKIEEKLLPTFNPISVFRSNAIFLIFSREWLSKL